MSPKIGCAVAAGVILLIALFGACTVGNTYNSLVTANESIDGAWAQVENVLQRRADLIPNLVETVRGYAEHEREVFENVAEARSRLAGAAGPEEVARAVVFLASPGTEIMTGCIVDVNGASYLRT